MRTLWVVAMVSILAASSAGSRNSLEGGGLTPLWPSFIESFSPKELKSTAGQSGARPPHSKEDHAVPAEFQNTDFKNLSYRTTLRGRVPLKDGRYEHRDRTGGGGDQIELRDVNYADLIGDDRAEAVVHLTQVSCGVSCDGGSDFFYFYSGARGRLRQLARLETGSLAYGCGLKSFAVEQRRLTVEVFQECTTNGSTLRLLRPIAGKFIARSYTRFVFRFMNVGLALEDRQTFPNINTEIMNYSPDIRIGN
jgi:hypothetical protein